ncbi:YidC/Oxa1 family membrane protein insertase [Plantactinospora sonchi]|uniref:Membrane protein insertase YidC n=1 Tax=Plantactinospora sonchi TaxID=1544735 RepID=A0ABU7RL48_9ACTN
MLAFAPLDGTVGAAAHLVSLLATLVGPVAGSAATAVAVVLFTVLVRLLISPLSWAQIRGQQRGAALAPQIRELRQRYADQPERLRAELLDLHRRTGASPLGGCLPALVQWPFFLIMYRLFALPGGAGDQAGLLAERLFGVPLGHYVADGLGGAAGPLYAVLVALLVLLAWLSSRRMRQAQAAAALPSAGSSTPARSASARPAPAGDEVLPGGAVLARVLPLLPYATVLAVAFVPLAAVLYLVTTTGWTALEQTLLRRRPRPVDVDPR